MKKDDEKIKNQQPEESEVESEKPEKSETAEKEASPEDNYSEPEETEKNEKSKEEEYLALAQRIQADFDNYRKRNISMRADALAEGKAEAVKIFLPVMDNLERALETERNNGTEGSLMEGLEMILKQMQKALADLGIEEIDALGKPFDPACHNAVMQIPCSDDQKPGTVAAVFAKGYKIQDKVIRYSMVQVTI